MRSETRPSTRKVKNGGPGVEAIQEQLDKELQSLRVQGSPHACSVICGQLTLNFCTCDSKDNALATNSKYHNRKNFRRGLIFRSTKNKTPKFIWHMRIASHKKLYCTGQSDKIKSRRKIKIPKLNHQKFLRLRQSTGFRHCTPQIN